VIGIVDYGCGNVAAIENVLTRLALPYQRVSTPEAFKAVEKVLLPGVGAFDMVMGLLEESGLLGALTDTVLERRTPALGICVGMQVMAECSEEGSRPGLGWIPGKVVRIDVSRLENPPFLPHMGWNSIKASPGSPLFEGVNEETGFYFLHSYRFECASEDCQLAVADYGGPLTAAVRREHIYGVQFHPEKSHANGVTLISNFAKL
jgi:glutamine amidotransferase